MANKTTRESDEPSAARREDDDSLREVAHLILRRAGFHVTAVADGRITRLVELYESRPRASIVVVSADGILRSSRPGVDLEEIPAALRPRL